MSAESEWVTIQTSRQYLGKMDEKGYHIKIPGHWMEGWYITVPYKLVRVDESNDWFTFASKPDFQYRMVKYGKDGVKLATSNCKGDYIIKIFAKAAVPTEEE